MFTSCKTVQDIREEYKRTVFKVHPDRHPASEFAKWNRVTQDLNAAYHIALEARHGEVSYSHDDNKEHTYYYNSSVEQSVVDLIDQLIHNRLPSHMSIWIIGTWLWIDGTTREDRDDQAMFKCLNLRWHSKRMKWYYNPTTYRASYNARASFEDLKTFYGAARVEQDADRGLPAS